MHQRGETVVGKMRLGLFEMRVVALDAGIQNGPDDTFAKGLKGALRGVGFHGAQRLCKCRADFLVFPDAVDDAAAAPVLRDKIARFLSEIENLLSGETGEQIRR